MRWNFLLGALGCLLTLLFSMSENPWLTTMVRSIYSFVTLFAFGFFFRWLLGTIVGLKRLDFQLEDTNQAVNDHRGQHFDQVTPMDQDIPLASGEMDAQSENIDQKQAGFSPLRPPKLESKEKLDSKELAQAVRHFSDK